MEQQGIYERIKGRVGQLKEESQDHFFTEYLVKLESSLVQEKYQLDLIEAGLERNLRIYQQRLEEAKAVGAPKSTNLDVAEGTPETHTHVCTLKTIISHICHIFRHPGDDSSPPETDRPPGIPVQKPWHAP